MKKNILGVTLARGGSKGIKNKNLANIHGKPLIYYTIKEAKKSKKITNYIISTDSIKIKKVAQKYNAQVPFIRPKKFSKDNSSSASALKHALIESEKIYNKKLFALDDYDALLNRHFLGRELMYKEPLMYQLVQESENMKYWDDWNGGLLNSGEWFFSLMKYLRIDKMLL